MKQFNLPDPGEGLVEAEIVTWLVSEGDEVKVNDPLVEIETSKSLVELPSPWAGRVAQILVRQGETVPVGTPIIVIDDAPADLADQVVSSVPAPSAEPTDVVSGIVSDASGPVGPTSPESPDSPASPPSPPAVGQEEKSGPMLVGYGSSESALPERRARRGGTIETNRTPQTDQVHESYVPFEPGHFAGFARAGQPHTAAPIGAPLPRPGSGPTISLVNQGDEVLAKPPVRKLARDLGVDLRGVTPTGPNGTVTREDVMAAAASSGTGSAGDRREPIKGVRKLTADAVTESLFTAPHVTEFTTVDVTATMDLVEQLKARREFAGLRVSPLLLVAKACCLAMSRNPELNSSWDDEAQEIVFHADVNLGIAAATPRGLLVPNIKGAQRLNLLELSQAVNHLVAVAKDGKTQPSDTAHGTFTITNVGVFGVDTGTPIINRGEAAILAMGSIERRPWVVGTGDDERIEPRWVMTLALSFDHRLVDGEPGSKFLHDVATILRDPALGLMF